MIFYHHVMELLQQQLSKMRIGLVHGRLTAAEKETIMASFKAGDIDDARIYNRILSEAEIMALYQLGTDEPSSLVGHWKLDDLSGTTAADSSGNANNGTLTNFPASPAWTSSGQRAGTLKFEELNDHILIPNDASLNVTSEITLAGWFKFDTFSNYSRLLGKVAADGYLMEVTDTRRLCFTIFGASANCGTGQITAGQWYHLAVTYDDNSDTILTYINGVLDDTLATTDTVSATSAGVRINDNGPNGWIGSGDDLRIYGQVLSATEIDALYKRGIGHCTDPVGKEGDIIMGDIDPGTGTDNAMLYCDGANWQTVGKTPP